MSGVGEAGLVLGLVSSVITIFEAAQEIYEATNDTQGLPKRFRAAAEQIPLVHHALTLAEQNLRTLKVDEQALRSVRPVLERCKENAARIKDIFEKTIPEPQAPRSERLRKAMMLKMKSKKLKEDMEEVIKDMELLAQHQVFQDAAALEAIRAGLEQLGDLPDDDEDLPQFVHSGTGAINVNTASGRQQNYNNAGSGHQYNAEKQFFGRDQVDRQINYHYYHHHQKDRESLVHNVNHTVDSPYSPTASEKGFLATIGPRRYIDIQERVDGTCVWSTETVQYQSWAHSSRSSILWVTGAAGTGKTTLTSYLVEHMREESDMGSGGLGLCSFFCSRDVEGQHDISSVLQDLILQLVEHNTKVLRQIKARYGITKQDHSWSFESVWRMFENAVYLSHYQCIYITIDALDECDDKMTSYLFEKLAKLLASLTSKSRANFKKVKLILSGQPRIRTAWDSPDSSIDHYHIDIDDSKSTTRDVSLFVEDKMSKLMKKGFFSEAVGQHLMEIIGSMSENSFLWLTIVFQHIKDSLHYRQAHLEDILSRIPQNSQQIYAKYLPHVENNEVTVLQRYLRLFVACSRPLKLLEIDILASLHDARFLPSLPIIAEDGEYVKASVRKALGPLIRFPNDTAQFIHSTAKDFFILLARQPDHPLHITHGTDPTQAHLFCLRLCMAYLLHESNSGDLFDAVSTDSPSIDLDSPVSDRHYQDEGTDHMTAHFFDLEEVCFLRDEGLVENEACTEIRHRLQAYDYAATNWTYHFAKCEALVDDDDVGKAINLLSPTSGHLNNWYRYSSLQSQLQRPPLSESSPIILAAMFDLTKLLNVLLYRTPEFQPSLQVQLSALYWATSRGSGSSVKLLLEYGVPVSSEQDRRLPLAVAARGNFPKICEYLLAAADMDPNQIDICGKPSLALAAAAGHIEVLRLLLSHRSIDVNRPDLDKRTALTAACRSRSTDSIRILREDGRANVNATDTRGQGPLHHTSFTGDLATINELVKFSNMDLGAVDKNGRNAISIAAQEGHLHMVRRLHRLKVDAAVMDRNGRNALSWAANSLKATEPINEKGESVLSYLVRKFPDEVDVPDENGWTPLAWALDTPGYVRSVLILTQCPKVDVNRRDETSGRCILAWAAAAGMSELVQHLLRRPDLEVDRASFNGQTALSCAAANGMIETVELLLQMGHASPHQPDNNGKTPADWAELNGFMNIALLLRAIAEPLE